MINTRVNYNFIRKHYKEEIKCWCWSFRNRLNIYFVICVLFLVAYMKWLYPIIKSPINLYGALMLGTIGVLIFLRISHREGHEEGYIDGYSCAILESQDPEITKEWFEKA
jgi:hypothetical protein